MATSPGTVSKILWHFTGGPRWNDTENRQDKKRKSDAQAYRALVGILATKELRLGGYKEMLQSSKSGVPGGYELEHVLKTVKTRPVCCLADIPIAHLNFHSIRYGKMAIGFRRSSAIERGFSPVFYQRTRSNIVSRAFASLGHIQEARRNLNDSRNQDRLIGQQLAAIQEQLLEIMAYAKTFEDHEFDSIYTEREWRSVEPFSFTFEDIVMIVLPRSGHHDYYTRFVRNSQSLALPRNTPIVPWEDLIEH